MRTTPTQRIGAHRTRTDAMRSAVPGTRQAGFTMVEIAICIAIVAFAMVAIIGVMPTGFRVQKDNREETIINQEGTFWIEAIRSGSLGMDYLTNYVERILVPATVCRWPGENKSRQILANDYAFGGGYTNGLDIIGLLSLPQYYEQHGWLFRTKALPTAHVHAYVRAITGMAAEKSPHNSFAFTYRLTPELVPFDPVAGLNTNFTAAGLSEEEIRARSNLWVKARSTQAHLYQLNLTLQWPALLPENPNSPIVLGPNRKVFRTLVSGGFWLNTNVTHLLHRPLFFLQPSEHSNFR